MYGKRHLAEGAQTVIGVPTLPSSYSDKEIEYIIVTLIVAGKGHWTSLRL